MGTRNSITLGARQRTFDAKAIAVNARDNSASIQSHFRTPFVGHLGASVPSEMSVMTYVLTLFFLRRPSYISLLVMSIIVDAINRVSRRRLGTEFSVELLKRREAKLDSPSPIQTICVMVRVGASSLCPTVAFIFRRLSFARSVSVGSRSESCNVALQTSTRFRVRAVSSQAIGRNDGPSPAVAFTEPLRLLSSIVPGKANSKQPPKTLIAKITGAARWVAGEFSIFTDRHFASRIGDLFRVGMSASIARPTRFIIHDFVVV